MHAQISSVFQTLEQFKDVVKQVQAMDEDGVFANPVKASEALYYFSFVRNPMDFSTLSKKLSPQPAHSLTLTSGGHIAATTARTRARTCAYATLQQAYDDLQRIFLNCMHYNKEIVELESSIATVARGLLEHARALVASTFA